MPRLSNSLTSEFISFLKSPSCRLSFGAWAFDCGSSIPSKSAGAPPNSSASGPTNPIVPPQPIAIGSRSYPCRIAGQVKGFDPIARIEYLVRLEEGRETKEGATDKPKAPPELLAEMFKIQEALADAKAGGLDETTRRTLTEQRERLLARHAEEEARLIGPLSAVWDGAAPDRRPALLAAFKQALATRAYLRTVIDDLGQALGEGDEIVAHHRH